MSRRPSPAIIDISHLDFCLGQSDLRKQILFDINLTIQAGEIVIITGPSGSGKTTLLTLMGGLRAAQQGSLKVLGKELLGLNRLGLLRLRRKIGYIFQAHNLTRSLTALQNVEIACEMRKNLHPIEFTAASMNMLERLGLRQYIHSYPHQLSIGQKQRVAVARALVDHPELILADEPTASLDKESSHNVVLHLQDIARSHGRTVVIITHDHRIFHIANRIIYLEDGRIVSIDSSKAIDAPKNPPR